MAINPTPELRRRRRLGLAISLVGAALLGSVALAQQAPRAAEPDVLKLRPNFYLIAGAGGNVSGSWTTDMFVEAMYKSLTAATRPPNAATR